MLASCFSGSRRPHDFLSVPHNNAIHQSRHQNDCICIPSPLRPGDGSVEIPLVVPRPDGWFLPRSAAWAPGPCAGLSRELLQTSAQDRGCQASGSAASSPAAVDPRCGGRSRTLRPRTASSRTGRSQRLPTGWPSSSSRKLRSRSSVTVSSLKPPAASIAWCSSS